MARHTIGNRRGSVRGAPPGVYIGFGTYADEDDREPWADAFRVFKVWTLMALVWVVIFSLLAVAVAFGWLPREIAD
jgi:hypothetical protein